MINAIKTPCQISDFSEAKLQKVYECSIEWYKNALTNGEDVWPIEGICSWIQLEE
jgi:hypothetical protein